MDHGSKVSQRWGLWSAILKGFLDLSWWYDWARIEKPLQSKEPESPEAAEPDMWNLQMCSAWEGLGAWCWHTLHKSSVHRHVCHVIYIGFNSFVICRLTIFTFPFVCERSESTKSKNTYSQLVLEDLFGDRDGEILRSTEGYWKQAE